jgi:hypothetical protein
MALWKNTAEVAPSALRSANGQTAGVRLYLGIALAGFFASGLLFQLWFTF